MGAEEVAAGPDATGTDDEGIATDTGEAADGVGWSI